MKLCTKIAHVTCNQCLWVTHTAKSVAKDRKKTFPFYSMSAQTKSVQRSRSELLPQLASVSATAACFFLLRTEFSCPPEGDIKLAKIQKSSLSAHSCKEEVCQKETSTQEAKLNLLLTITQTGLPLKLKQEMPYAKMFCNKEVKGSLFCQACHNFYELQKEIDPCHLLNHQEAL